MTIALVGTIQRWEGLSTDAKPTEAKAGSTFRETDTGRKFVWRNGGWIEDLSEPASAHAFAEKQADLRRLAESESIKPGSNITLDGHYNFIEIR